MNLERMCEPCVGNFLLLVMLVWTTRPEGMVAQEIVIGKHFLPARCTETHVNLGFWSAPSAPIAPNRVGPAQQISPILVTIND